MNPNAMTVTAKIKIIPQNNHDISLLKESTVAYRNACNFVSELIFRTKNMSQHKLHNETYETLRNDFGLRSQMAQSVLKTVIARYKTNRSNGHDWSLVVFKKCEYDLVWNRDYSLSKDTFSVNTLGGRIKIPFHTEGMEPYFQIDNLWKFGTAKLIHKYGKWFLHIPMTKEVQSLSNSDINNVVGIDFGINFIATTYDSLGKTAFFNGKTIKHKRAHYKHLRKELQQKQTPSARRRLKKMGSRENRWMTDVNHSVSKALVDRYKDQKTLFVIEDLTGVRNATEKVRLKNRYTSVSWAFYQLRQMLEYKATLSNGKAKVIAVSPKYTSQTCPKCGHTEKTNRNKKTHTFCCKTCNYQSNDDRIGAINLQRKGIEYIVEETKEA